MQIKYVFTRTLLTFFCLNSSGFNERTVRTYVKEFYENNMSFRETQQGKYERHRVLADENLRKEASKWVRENGFKKGEPNMTAAIMTRLLGPIGGL